MYGVDSVFETVFRYNGGACVLVLFVAACIYCFIRFDTKKRRIMLVAAILSIVCIYNDAARWFISKFTDVATYYRFLWAIPMIPVMAYVIVDVVFIAKKRYIKIGFLIIVAAVLAFGNQCYLQQYPFRVPENKYNIPADVLQVCDIISQDKDKENPVVVADLAVQLPIRTYDASILWGVTRDAYIPALSGDESAKQHLYQYNIIQVVYFGQQEEMNALVQSLQVQDIDYLVIRTDYQMDEYMAEAFCSVVDRSDTYTVYRFDKESA